MKTFIKLCSFTVLLLTMGFHQNVISQTHQEHLFKDEEPPHVQTHVLITDDRDAVDSNSTSLTAAIKQNLTDAFPAVNFHFAEKTSQLKRSGDNINILISIKAHGIPEDNSAPKTQTHYHITIYDVSRTPIYIQDGNVKYIAEGVSEAALQKSFNVANQRLVSFLQRNIKHNTFCERNSDSNS